MRNKIEKNTCQRKIITRIRQYLRGSTIYLRPQSCRNFTIIKENTKCGSTFFFSLKKTTTRNPNHQNNDFYILRTGFTVYRPNPSLHGLSLGKSPIKKPRNIILDRIVIRIKHNQAPQSPRQSRFYYKIFITFCLKSNRCPKDQEQSM